MKALLCLDDIEYPKTHDLRALVLLLPDRGYNLPVDPDDLVDLTDFAVQFRYEAIQIDEPLQQAGILDKVRALLEHVEALEAVR